MFAMGNFPPLDEFGEFHPYRNRRKLFFRKRKNARGKAKIAYVIPDFLHFCREIYTFSPISYTDLYFVSRLLPRFYLVVGVFCAIRELLLSATQGGIKLIGDPDRRK